MHLKLAGKDRGLTLTVDMTLGPIHTRLVRVRSISTISSMLETKVQDGIALDHTNYGHQCLAL